ncbi:MAG: DoxX family protein, partial [Phycisphaerales bacterium]
VVSWVLQVIVAGILVQTLFFKFAGAAESKYIFGTLGVEPYGRYAAGIAELVAAVLLLRPRTAAVGAATALGVITGAIGAHLTKLGIEVQGDGGLLFGLALAVFAGSATVLVIRRAQLPIVGPRLVALGLA